jgi:hypothetical protein
MSVRLIVGYLILLGMASELLAWHARAEASETESATSSPSWYVDLEQAREAARIRDRPIILVFR